MRRVCQFAVVATLCTCCLYAWAADKVPNAKATNQPNASRSSADRSKFADYKTWKPINAEPIQVPLQRSRLCEPAGRLVDPHQGGFVSVYVNDAGRKNYAAAKPAVFAESTVIVKEKLRGKDADEPDELGIMVKRENGYDPKAGDWQFLFVDEKQHLTTERSKLTNCIDCHKRQATSDYVFGLPKPEAKNNRSY